MKEGRWIFTYLPCKQTEMKDELHRSFRRFNLQCNLKRYKKLEIETVYVNL